VYVQFLVCWLAMVEAYPGDDISRNSSHHGYCYYFLFGVHGVSDSKERSGDPEMARTYHYNTHSYRILHLSFTNLFNRYLLKKQQPYQCIGVTFLPSSTVVSHVQHYQ
jgi:hypothetical protein